MTCRITVSDGVDTAVMENANALGIAFAPVQEGGSLLRFLDGSLAKQQRWYKETYTVTGEGRVPPELRALSYTGQLTITVETGLGTDVYTAMSMGPTENWNLTGGTISWSLVAEQD